MWYLYIIIINAQGYADEIVLLLVGKFSLIVTELLRTVEFWGKKVGLSVNPDKTEMIPFTK